MCSGSVLSSFVYIVYRSNVLHVLCIIGNYMEALIVLDRSVVKKDWNSICQFY
jgi:hypothetical protein